MKNIYQFSVKTLTGSTIHLKQYDGKVLLIVNTASKCGFTPQYKQLEQLYQKYKAQGLEILAFPSNDFGQQEPLEGEGIGQFCQRNYGVSFTVFEKTRVKGKEASELFKFLSNKKENGRISSKPKWNFHKYLIDQEGRVVDYFYSFTSPTSRRVMQRIERLLKQ